MTDWEIYDNNLPKSTTSTQLIPYYREGKLFNGTNRSHTKLNFTKIVLPLLKYLLID